MRYLSCLAFKTREIFLFAFDASILDNKTVDFEIALDNRRWLLCLEIKKRRIVSRLFKVLISDAINCFKNYAAPFRDSLLFWIGGV